MSRATGLADPLYLPGALICARGAVAQAPVLRLHRLHLQDSFCSMRINAAAESAPDGTAAEHVALNRARILR